MKKVAAKWFLFRNKQINVENLPEQWRGGFRNLSWEKRKQMLEFSCLENQDQKLASLDLWVSLLKCVWVFCNTDDIDRLGYQDYLNSIDIPEKQMLINLREGIDAKKSQWKIFAHYREFWNDWIRRQKMLDKSDQPE